MAVRAMRWPKKSTILPYRHAQAHSKQLAALDWRDFTADLVRSFERELRLKYPLQTAPMADLKLARSRRRTHYIVLCAESICTLRGMRSLSTLGAGASHALGSKQRTQRTQSNAVWC